MHNCSQGAGSQDIGRGNPLDDESLKAHCTIDDVAAIADWLEDNKDSDVADELQTLGAEGPKQDKSWLMLEALDDVAAEWLVDNEETGTADELHTPGVEYPTKG